MYNLSAFKILVLGSSGTGKTSIVKRFINNEFTSEYIPTSSIDFYLTKVTLTDPIITTLPEGGFASIQRKPNQENVEIHFWEVSGLEINNKMTSVYYKNASAAIIVFDLSSDKKFSSIISWLNNLRSNMETNIPVFVLGNKNDLVHYDTTELIKFCNDNKIDGWSLVSALENSNITSRIHVIIDELLTNKQSYSNRLGTMNISN